MASLFLDLLHWWEALATILKSCGKSTHRRLVPDLGGQSSCFYHAASCRFTAAALIRLKKFSSVSILLRTLNRVRCWIQPHAYCFISPNVKPTQYFCHDVLLLHLFAKTTLWEFLRPYYENKWVTFLVMSALLIRSHWRGLVGWHAHYSLLFHFLEAFITLV